MFDKAGKLRTWRVVIGQQAPSIYRELHSGSDAWMLNFHKEVEWELGEAMKSRSLVHLEKSSSSEIHLPLSRYKLRIDAFQ